MQPISYHWRHERVPWIFQRCSSKNHRLVSKRTDFRQFSELGEYLHIYFISLCVLSIYLCILMSFIILRVLNNLNLMSFWTFRTFFYNLMFHCTNGNYFSNGKQLEFKSKHIYYRRRRILNLATEYVNHWCFEERGCKRRITNIFF